MFCAVALILNCWFQYVQNNKAADNDWFRLESNKEGTRWFGKCWYIQNLLKYEFEIEFDVSSFTFFLYNKIKYKNINFTLSTITLQSFIFKDFTSLRLKLSVNWFIYLMFFFMFSFVVTEHTLKMLEIYHLWLNCFKPIYFYIFL